MHNGFRTRPALSRRPSSIAVTRSAKTSAAIVTATLAVFLLCLSSPLHAQLKPVGQQELDAVKVLLTQERDWNKGDINAFAKGYKNSPDTIFIGRQVSKGYDQMLSDYHHNYPTPASMGTLGFSELEARPLDDHFAIVIGKYHLDRSKKEGGNADGTFSLVLEKTDQGWKIVLDHTT